MRCQLLLYMIRKKEVKPRKKNLLNGVLSGLLAIYLFAITGLSFAQQMKPKNPVKDQIILPPGKRLCYYVERINRIEVNPVPFDTGSAIRIFVALQVRSTLVNSFNYERECGEYARYLTYFVEKETEDGRQDWFGEWKDKKGNWTSDIYNIRLGSPEISNRNKLYQKSTI